MKGWANQGPGKLKWLVAVQLLPPSMSRAAVETLASRAEVCPAVLHDDSLDGAAANGAEFTTSVGNLEIEMGCAQLAPRHLLSVPNVY